MRVAPESNDRARTNSAILFSASSPIPIIYLTRFHVRKVASQPLMRPKDVITTVAMAMLGFCCSNRTDDFTFGARNTPQLRDITISRSMCDDERTCDELYGSNSDGCNAHLDSCLNALTPDQ